MPPWKTRNGCPEIVAVSVRAAPAFGATTTLTPTLPAGGGGPCVSPAVGKLEAVSGQPIGASTAMYAGPPAAVALTEAGLKVYEPVEPYCVIVNSTPFTEMVPLRSVEPGFASTV